LLNITRLSSADFYMVRDPSGQRTPAAFFRAKRSGCAGVGALQQAPLALSNLLPLLCQRNRRTCYNFAGLGIEDSHYLFLIPIVERMRLRPPVQFFQPLSQFNPACFTSIAMFTVWTVDS
jgi:hypothetical protein